MLNGMFDEKLEAAASLTEVKLDSDKPAAFVIGATLCEKSGLSFCRVFNKGACAQAGVSVGDELLAFNEKAVSSLEDVKSYLKLCSNDNSVRLTLRSTDGSVCERVVQGNTAFRQEPDACDRIGTPVTAQVAQNVQPEADSTPEICGTVPTDALVKGKDEKILAQRTQATYNRRADGGEEGCAAAANIGGAGPTERRDLGNSPQVTSPQHAPPSDTMATDRCLNATEVIASSATDSVTIASSKKTATKADSTDLKRKLVDVSYPAKSTTNSQTSLLVNFEVYISLNICVFLCSFDICIECINKCLICIFFSFIQAAASNEFDAVQHHLIQAESGDYTSNRKSKRTGLHRLTFSVSLRPPMAKASVAGLQVRGACTRTQAGNLQNKKSESTAKGPARLLHKATGADSSITCPGAAEKCTQNFVFDFPPGTAGYGKKLG